MALIKCKECGAMISDKAGHCPHCGAPLRIVCHMGFMEAVSTCFRKYATFKGRARRAEYWYFSLFTWLLGIFIWLSSYLSWITPTVANVLYIVVCAATFIPSWAVTVRRFHDVNKSGWYLLWIIIPFLYSILILPLLPDEWPGFVNFIIFILGSCYFIGFVIIIVFSITKSSEGDNQYGPSPLYKDID